MRWCEGRLCLGFGGVPPRPLEVPARRGQHVGMRNPQCGLLILSIHESGTMAGTYQAGPSTTPLARRAGSMPSRPPLVWLLDRRHWSTVRQSAALRGKQSRRRRGCNRRDPTARTRSISWLLRCANGGPSWRLHSSRRPPSAGLALRRHLSRMRRRRLTSAPPPSDCPVGRIGIPPTCGNRSVSDRDPTATRACCP